MTIKEYWNLIGQEPFSTITWEPDFSQACSFCRLLMNHKNFCFTRTLDKTNNMIFKSPKTLFLSHFWPSLVIFARLGFFLKNPALSHTTIYEPLTPCYVSEKPNEPTLRKLTADIRTDGQTLPAKAGGQKSCFIAFWAGCLDTMIHIKTILFKTLKRARPPTFQNLTSR